MELQYQLYHKVMSYDHFIAYSKFDCFVVAMEAVTNYLADREIWNAKVTLTSCVVKYKTTAVLYSTLLDRILSS